MDAIESVDKIDTVIENCTVYTGDGSILYDAMGTRMTEYLMQGR